MNYKKNKNVLIFNNFWTENKQLMSHIESPCQSFSILNPVLFSSYSPLTLFPSCFILVLFLFYPCFILVLSLFYPCFILVLSLFCPVHFHWIKLNATLFYSIISYYVMSSSTSSYPIISCSILIYQIFVLPYLMFRIPLLDIPSAVSQGWVSAHPGIRSEFSSHLKE